MKYIYIYYNNGATEKTKYQIPLFSFKKTPDHATAGVLNKHEM